MNNLQSAIPNYKLAWAVLLAAAMPCRAEPPPAVPVDGPPFAAELVAAEADWQLVFRTPDGMRKLAAADLVRWGRCPGQGRAGRLALVNGGMIEAEVAAADRDRVSARSRLLGPLALPREAVAAVEFSPLPLEDDTAARAAKTDDCLMLLNGDQLSGSFIQLADGMIKFHAAFGPLEIKTDRVAAVVFRSDNPPPAKQEKSLRVWVGLGDGSRLPADALSLNGHEAAISMSGETFSVPAEQIVFLQPQGGRAAYLSDMRPVEYHYSPYLRRAASDADLPTPAWPWRADRNVLGGPLRADGRYYLKGIGVHAAARLVYELDSGDAGIRDSSTQGPTASAAGKQRLKTVRFEALTALDQSAGRGGSVRFRVLVDGQEKYAGPVVRGGQPPVPISVELGDAKRLELVVDFADRADVLARADWLDARLILESGELKPADGK
jgi:hypothetical protein